MILMEKKEIESEINKINTFLLKCSWMDFHLVQMDPYSVKMSGSIDESFISPAIEIVFEHVHFISTLFEWTIDKSKPFIQLVSENEDYKYTNMFNVEIDNYIFKMNIDGIREGAMIIASKKIHCNILNEHPF